MDATTKSNKLSLEADIEVVSDALNVDKNNLTTLETNTNSKIDALSKDTIKLFLNNGIKDFSNKNMSGLDLSDLNFSRCKFD